MIGILAEKPSAARNFAKALGGQKGTYNGEPYVIASSHGHLYEFADPDKQVSADKAKQYKSWNTANLPWNEKDFNWKREMKSGSSETVKNIRQVLSGCDEICIATDNDPSGEGELLAWEILSELKLRPAKWSRMYFDDEAVPSVQKAFRERKTLQGMLQDPDYIKANYRSQWDFLSMQFTRIAKECGDGVSVLRQGRLKSAMVLLTGNGLKALSEYKKIPYYQNRFRDENGIVYTNPAEPQYKTQAEVPQTYHACPVVKDSAERKTAPPPRLYDLSALSAALAPKGIKAKQVLDVYQRMYEDQIVSYPRTEDKTITPEQFNELLPYADRIAELVGVDPSLLTHRTPRSSHVREGAVHGANRPGTNVPKSLEDLDIEYGFGAKQIYTLLAKNYLAILAEDYVYNLEKGHPADYPDFKGRAKVPVSLGWKNVFTVSSDNDDKENSDNEDAGRGLGSNAEPFVYEGFPPKPPVPTMKWLMKQLEKRDVGTGATRTSIYADVTNDKNKYPLLQETKGKLSMTEYGKMSYQLLPDTHIGDLKITEQLMSDMRQIAAGTKNPQDCLHEMQQMVLDDLRTMKKNGASIKKAATGTMYGRGWTEMDEKDDESKYYGEFEGKEIWFYRDFRGHTLTDEECECLCSGEEVKLTDLYSKQYDKNYSMKIKLGEKESKAGRTYVGIVPVPRDPIPDAWSGHAFTAEEKKALLDGESLQLTDCVSRTTGRSFKAEVNYMYSAKYKRKCINVVRWID